MMLRRCRAASSEQKTRRRRASFFGAAAPAMKRASAGSLFSWLVLLFLLLLCWSRKDRDESSVAILGSSKDEVFPTFDDTFEMATLSSLIYAFHKEDYGNDQEAATEAVCGRVNVGNVTERPMPAGIHCHWYYHDWTGGAQVMIVTSHTKRYIAVVFAGTDDLRTSLTDANIFTTAFGTRSSDANNDDNNPNPYPFYNVSLPDPNVRVHAGFDHSVFDRNLFGGILSRVEQLRRQKEYAGFRLMTTGHSLGAANAVLVGVGMTQYYEQQRKKQQHQKFWQKWWWPIQKVPEHMTSISFGCPQIGNSYWRDFLHNDPVLSERLTVWRHVLGRDLVPRLPQIFYHAGHTVQWWYQKDNYTALAYYHHYGNETLHLAGVPLGWSIKPYYWVPGALLSHSMTHYWEFLVDWQQANQPASSSSWVSEFVPASDDDGPDDDDDDHRPPNVDDDFYVDPPDDDAFSSYARLRGGASSIASSEVVVS